MKGKTMKRLLALMLTVTFAQVLHAEDWPQWLGPRRDGSSEEKVAPWTEPLKILWRKPVGEGHSSPVVSGGRVYLHTKVANKTEEQLSAFDAQSGEPSWSTPYERGKFASLFGAGPRATPSVVGGKVYTFGITGILTCFDGESGKQVWQADTLKKYQAPNLFFGASCSPLVDGGLVFVNVGGKDASLAAFDGRSGDERWKTGSDKASYSSPIAVGAGDTRQVIFLTASGLVSVAPRDGSVFWKHALVDKLAESSTTPVVVGDILFASSITYGGEGLKLESDQGRPTAKPLWMRPELNCYFSTPVAVGKEHLYVITGTRPPALVTKATLRCIEAATGKELWNRDNVGKYHASLLRTGDGKLLLLEEAGDLVLLQPDPSQYRELARSKICGSTWAHPALANGRLYVRDGKELICVQLAH
jgi:outer membrane protein assembly factor BamB